MLGNAMEWFDFGVYAYLATTIGKVFFPDASGSAQLLSTFAIFAAAFIVRPLGGLFFGPLGDRIGRKKVLATTIILMAGSTFAIGLIPSYESIGIAAPILLVLLRLLQGFSTGGEYGGASTFVAEYAPDKRRGFFASFLEFGTLAGYVAAAGIVTIIQTVVSAEDLLQWGWRIPFLIAGPLGLIGLYLRLRLEETPAFQMMEQAEERSLADESTGKKLRETLVDNWRPLVLCIVLVATYNIAHYGLLSYMPTYLTNTLGYDESHGLVLMIIVMIVMMMGISYVGKFSDRVGRKPLLLSGFIGFFVLSLPAYLLIGVGNYVTVFLGLAILGGLLLLFVGVVPVRASRTLSDRNQVRRLGNRIQPRGLHLRRDHSPGAHRPRKCNGQQLGRTDVHDDRRRDRRYRSPDDPRDRTQATRRLSALRRHRRGSTSDHPQGSSKENEGR